MHANMGFFAIDDTSLILTHVLYRAALIYTVLRWVISWAIKFKNRNLSSSSSSDFDAEEKNDNSCHAAELQTHMVLSTYGDMSERLIFPDGSDMCAVCLTQLRDQDEVRQLRNCCHVFHKECIDKWVKHDSQNNHKACPLCRTPLVMQPVGSPMASCCPNSQPSWAVERLLYLFGDDLLN